MTPPFLTSLLLEQPGLSHGFFSRTGGVSEGVYASLNNGVGSQDNPDHVRENRRRSAAAIGCAEDHLLTGHQTHSAEVIIVDGPWAGAQKKADGLVTNKPGLALGVLAADCMPWLFADLDAGVIGAAHAGWRGALAGILENTVSTMETLGAKRENITAALGPSMRQPNFEVSLDLLAVFTDKYGAAGQFFAAGVSDEKRQFDLAGFGAWRLRESGVEKVDDLDVCTLGNPTKYFSYRATCRRGEKDYGRNLSAIALT